MAIQTRITRLKLHDDEPKTLGVMFVTPGSVACDEGLIEGTDFAVDARNGLIRRLKPFGRELYTFRCQYDDRAEHIAAKRAAKQAKLDALKQAAATSAPLRALLDYLGIA